MLKKLLTYSLLACCLLFGGCNNDVVFEKTMSIDDGNWTYENVLVFDFSIINLTKKYDLLLDLEHAGDYGFQNLYVKFLTRYPSGETKTQTVSLELASKSGIWNGKCSGNTCTVEIPLQTNATFNETGDYQISIEQFMRKSPLPGIKSMTLKVKTVEDK